MLFTEQTAPTPKIGKLDPSFLHSMGCKACPYSKIKSNHHPSMPASGAARPDVYIIGEAPGATEDEEGKQFVGSSGRLLRSNIPRQFRDRVRFNNVVRTRPPGDETPVPVAVECCRPSVEQDIANSRPKVILGFGEVPLKWVSGFSRITDWRGRRMPVAVSGHKCWYYPILHPAFLGYTRDRAAQERVLAQDLRNAFQDVEDGLPEPVVHTPKDVWAGLECVTEFGSEGLARIEKLLHWAAGRPNIGLDYETDRLRPYAKGARILSAALDDGEKGFSFSFEHPEAQWTDAELAKLCELWKEFLRRAKGKLWVHNLAFELEWTGVFFGDEFVVPKKWEDTATQAVLLDERVGGKKPGCLSLEFLVQQHFGINLKKLSNVNRAKLSDVPLDLLLRYNGGDSRYHCLLGLAQQELLTEQGLDGVYEIARRRPAAVVRMQIKGVPVDQKEVDVLRVKYEARVRKTTAEIMQLPVVKKFQAMKGHKFNPHSSDDNIELLRDVLKIDNTKYDKKAGKERYSADVSILREVKDPIAEKLIALRSDSKQLSTYINPMVDGGEGSIIHDDGLMHSVFNTLFAETGRLSSEEPNLQNYPKRNENTKEVRRPIKAPPGCVMLAFDYGQIEARVIAMFTHDKRFCKALWERYDVHQEWAERLARAYPSRIGGKKNLNDKKAMKDFRTDIKNQWTFPLFFGATLQSASTYLHIPEDVLEPEYNLFWDQFSGVKKWQEKTLNFYKEYGYVECLTGRRRRAPLSLNQIINSPIQGTAAEIVVEAMCRLSEKMDPEIQPEINIHDDLTFCRVPIKRVDDIAEKIIGEMLFPPWEWSKTVPISVEMQIGPNWSALEGAGDFFSDKW